MIVVEIQWGTIAWEGSDAVFIMITDAQVVHQYQRVCSKMKQQEYIQATVCHEMRTPLGIMLQLLEDLREKLSNMPKGLLPAESPQA